jgi:hypothetical protein
MTRVLSSCSPIAASAAIGEARAPVAPTMENDA